MTAGAGRGLVAERGLTPAAVGALIPLMGDVGFEELGSVKALLKRFFSAGPWTAVDAAALARAVGPSPRAEDRVRRRRLDADLTLIAGWVDGAFFVDVEVAQPGAGSAPREARVESPAVDFGATFDTGVVPEPTPNPRTIRFATARRAGDGSRSYGRRDARTDPRVAALFDTDADVDDVLVGPAFVAISITRPSRWPDLLEPLLRAVAAGFGGTDEDGGGDEAGAVAVDVRGGGGHGTHTVRPDRRRTSLDRAWSELAVLDPARPGDLEQIVRAARSTDTAERQVAARLLADAPSEVAHRIWDDLLRDRSRTVRRATLDAVVDAEREDLRAMLERSLADDDAWARWKALHGLVVLGPRPSLAAIASVADDPDFRVRLEAANATRAAG